MLLLIELQGFVYALSVVRSAARFLFARYRAGLSGPVLDFTMKKYKSQGSIPAGIVESVTQQLKVYLKAKALSEIMLIYVLCYY